MEILKFDAGKRTNLSKVVKPTGVSSNVKTNQNLKRKLIAAVSCTAVKSISGGCCAN